MDAITMNEIERAVEKAEIARHPTVTITTREARAMLEYQKQLLHRIDEILRTGVEGH